MDRLIVEIIETLPEEYQIILRAHYVGNKSVDEIAQILGVPPESVARIIKAGRSALTKRLGL